MKFLSNLLAAILGCLVAFGIIFVMFFVFASLLSNIEDSIAVDENSVLELQLQLPISDYVGGGGEDPFSSLFEQSQGLDEIINAIRVAKNDDNIKGISIVNNSVLPGLAQTQEIRRALQDFKSEGKFIYAYADFYVQKDYYLASVADSIFVNKVGDLDFKGLSSEVLFYKDIQDKTGVKMEVIRHGKYKSAVEPFLANEMSIANRTQIKELIESLWGTMISEVSKSRSISEEDLNVIADTLGGRTPQFAKDVGLIDGAIFYDMYETKLMNALGVDGEAFFNVVLLEDYVSISNKKIKTTGKNKIAVIFAQGEIVYGEGSQEIIGQGIMVKALQKAKEDEKVKAIVLRVDSPGGSALASDIIWREVELAKAVKPVIVSMGNVAASGGYYIAAGADVVFAEPTTITGSIGVFGTVPNIAELAGEIGVNAEQVGTNKNSIGYSLFEPMSDTFRNTVQEGVKGTYDTFLERVSQGRNMSVEEVHNVAQGRVWSGVDAKRIGLVDELGNLDDAIVEAAKIAEIENYGIKKFPRYKTGLELLMEDMGSVSTKVKKSLIEEEIGVEVYSVLKQMKSVVSQKGIQARMPFALNIK